MTEHNASDQIKPNKAKECRNHDMLTHFHVDEVQLGAEILAKANKKKKNEASGAATRGRDISCPTPLRNVASGGTRRKERCSNS
jgi:hypothetical protein